MSTERSETPAVTHRPVDVVSLRAAASALPDRSAPRAASPSGGGGGAVDSDWERYLGAVRRRKWLVLALTALGTLLGVLASRLLAPEYSATALLWFEAEDRSRDPRATEPDELLNPSGWIDLVESNAVLEDVVRERRLYLQPRSPNDSSAVATLQLTGAVTPGTYRYAVD